MAKKIARGCLHGPLRSARHGRFKLNRNSPMYRLCLVCFSLAFVWNFGCAPAQKSSPPAASVKGIVNLDGKPVPTGEIHFGMTGLPPSVLEIKDGTFSGEVPVGKNQVEVFIYVEGPPSEKRGGARSK